MGSRAPRPFRILICDDEQAVARAASDAPDLILLDLGLPGIDGRETIRRIRAFLPDAPIIVRSAWAEDQTEVEALDLGADDDVEKPFAVPELLARIQTAAGVGYRFIPCCDDRAANPTRTPS